MAIQGVIVSNGSKCRFDKPYIYCLEPEEILEILEDST